jgi:hypothetical protein
MIVVEAWIIGKGGRGFLPAQPIKNIYYKCQKFKCSNACLYTFYVGFMSRLV